MELGKAIPLLFWTGP